MEPVEVLKQALAAVAEAKVPAELKAVAFAKAVDLLTGTSAAISAAGSRRQRGSESTGGSGASSERLSRLADALGIPGDEVEAIYMEHGDDLQVVADPGKLGSSNVQRVQQVALLLVGGRQLGGWDESTTPDSYVRAEVDRHGLLDTTNYTKQIKAIGTWVNINGSGKGATYKLKFPGRQKLRDVAAELVVP